MNESVWRVTQALAVENAQLSDSDVENEIRKDVEYYLTHDLKIGPFGRKERVNEIVHEIQEAIISSVDDVLEERAEMHAEVAAPLEAAPHDSTQKKSLEEDARKREQVIFGESAHALGTFFREQYGASPVMVRELFRRALERTLGGAQARERGGR